MKNLDSFLKLAEQKAFDPGHRQRINFNISRYNAKVPEGRKQFADYEHVRSRAAAVKRKVVNNLEKYLLDFELNFTKRGGEVFWAETEQDAITVILELLNKHNCKSVVKSKSMISEEIHLNEHLEKNNITPVETDLGEFIVQLNNEPPYHIVTPAMHKSKKDVAELFHDKLGTPLEYTPEQLTLEARKVLRNKFINADAGITGANFIIAGEGAISVTENEGNARMSTSLPEVHIVLAGIERILPSIDDLHLFLPLLSTAGTGQKITSYNTLFFGPKTQQEIDGPTKMYVILINNGRTNILEQPKQREALACIRCGACLNACPVYKNIGGHTYRSAYNGPIGAVITPFMRGFNEFGHLSFATSVCGACADVCPVKIPIHDLLLYNKNHYIKNYQKSKTENFAFSMSTKILTSRKMMNRGSGGLRNTLTGIALKNTWNKRKEPMKFPARTFNQLWKDKRNKTSK